MVNSSSKAYPKITTAAETIKFTRLIGVYYHTWIISGLSHSMERTVKKSISLTWILKAKNKAHLSKSNLHKKNSVGGHDMLVPFKG